jgi:hypothetical protein
MMSEPQRRGLGYIHVLGRRRATRREREREEAWSRGLYYDLRILRERERES